MNPLFETGSIILCLCAENALLKKDIKAMKNVNLLMFVTTCASLLLASTAVKKLESAESEIEELKKKNK